MSSGYVADFSDATFGNFFAEEVEVDIHLEIYRAAGTSKANELRQFWKIEDDFAVGKALTALIRHVKEREGKAGIKPV